MNRVRMTSRRAPRSSLHHLLRPHVHPLDQIMMLRAIELAQQASGIGEVPVGAVVYRGRQILGEGFNLRESTNDPTAHAEMLAICQAAARLGSWRLKGCQLAVTLEPCPMCAGAIVNSRIDRVVYGARDHKMGCVDSLHDLLRDSRFNHQCEVIDGVMADHCARLLKVFFRQRRREKRHG